MAQNSPTAWRDWLPVLSFIIVIVGALLAGGGYIAQMKDNTRRIEILEQKSDGRDDKLNAIDSRTTRIEAKLEILLPPEQRSAVQ